jgi:hypothetical protein
MLLLIMALLFFCCVTAAVRRNPICKQLTMKTMQLVTAKWLFGARDREGGHKIRNKNRQQIQDE